MTTPAVRPPRVQTKPRMRTAKQQAVSCGARRKWTDYEIGFIQDHDDWPVERIADELGRTVDSVRQKRTSVRRGWTPTENAWSAMEDDFLLANPRMSESDASSHLRRTPGAVGARRIVLAKRGNAALGFGKNFAPSRVGARPLLAKTCPNCGLLLQAMWFNKNRVGYTRLCGRCVHRTRTTKQVVTDRQRRQHKEFVQKYQALTIAGASRNGQPWVESDFKVLQDPDMTAFQKALALHRTYKATARACQINGFKSKVGLGDPERDQWIIENPNMARVEEISGHSKRAELVSAGRPDFDWDD